ncbi:hypothetical protein [Pyrobaculum ferrireducens]|uniref:Uncharacterized protein n=1 Tax=Pyrobaculum ferrireducens TaxID=1104324 RepID=G7VC69_9CREN|nr:hypothetical protein [Pyrobaculum ferrireducens]AET33755.1 hypothetical protein P186_2367 [Pyrobaculum ferrireducens]
MRGQIILLTAVLVAVAVVAVLVLQSIASSSPGYGGVRAAYGVFSRDVSKAVGVLSSYVDYMGLASLVNFSASSARYAFLTSALPYTGGANAYLYWLHMNRTLAMMNSTVVFFELNRGVLGLSVKQPTMVYRGGRSIKLYTPGYFNLTVMLQPVPNGTHLTQPLPSWVSLSFYDSGGIMRSVNNFTIVLASNLASALYRSSVVMNVSLLALAGLNVTAQFGVSIRVLPQEQSGSVCGDYICINITTTAPYGWTAYITVLNRTILQGDSYSIYYKQVAASYGLYNYTTYSAVYWVDLSGMYVEPLLRVTVGDVQLYLLPFVTITCPQLSQNQDLKNRYSYPLVYFNITAAPIAPGIGKNVTRIDFSFRDYRVTYWVVHQGGVLSIGSGNLQNLKSLWPCSP